ncbi:MAG TPA: Mrp/NBP35 family ATP-binding protein [Ktedonobacteraceae bacterium]|nr:Mrp/NBP35 family ATP-binding protein [Ktedonobacteraceae bacterium]
MQGRFRRERIEQVAHLIVVGSGKGGVGKSTVSVNLAVALARRGYRVGLLDADTYGPSVPMMLGVRKRGESQGWRATLPLAQRDKLAPEQMVQPLSRYGVKVISVGFFIGEEQAVAPMPDVQGMLIRQLLHTVNWGTLDYLLIDLPPGNGEPQATLCRELELDGAILVTTPQDIARIDTAKGAGMFQSAGVPILGLVQNMAGFICPNCGERVDIFPVSSEASSLLHDMPLLGVVPLDLATARSGDSGQPIVVTMPESPVSAEFYAIAGQVVDQLLARRTSDQESATDETEMEAPEDEQ